MSHKAPPIPPEQRSFRGQKPNIEGQAKDGNDRKAQNREARAGKPNQFQHHQQDR